MKILVVCLGNICRSPLAHGVLQHFVNERGLDWVVDSAGTGGWHVDNPPDHRAIAIAKRHGIDISKQRAKQLHNRHLDEFDYILAMDRNNLKSLLAQAKTSEQRARIQLFMGDREVPDPYYDNRLFEVVFQMVEERCRELLRMWEK
ncbi:low molecular weight protein-tyrosine-phosphatase [Parapedobacter koreensis]|uniref:protein-tyrosine-phosphatase n=1 Tax=Parapedobacter koreensis TaxID=332977 RepID=A0A1H7T4T6_9SPHI|nr:low molecular weight protein-tyrosine-phosphatase [Parapedobacter koreensis]SEL79910.1 protein tyrosine phosphatase [Parapedobacter koreensis]